MGKQSSVCDRKVLTARAGLSMTVDPKPTCARWTEFQFAAKLLTVSAELGHMSRPLTSLSQNTKQYASVPPLADFSSLNMVQGTQLNTCSRRGRDANTPFRALVLRPFVLR